MFKVQTFNKISIKGLEQFTRDHYEVASEVGHPDAILLRSHKLKAEDVPGTIKAIARAGAGTNNVPVSAMSERGVVVFNTPGANANAVKELVLAAMLLGSRGILSGASYAKSCTNITTDSELAALMEQEKKQFAGSEIAGKTLGVVGLGAIGSMVANMAIELGMSVVGYDPALTVESALRLSSKIRKVEHLPGLLAASDYITLHLPAIESTRHLISHEAFKAMKTGTRLLNFAREEIVDEAAVIEALNAKKIDMYISDFPTVSLLSRKDVILTPHIGASTEEAEDNCAVMAAQQLKDFLENGNIKNSVNFPTLILERSTKFRLAIGNKNVPKVLGQVLAVLADANINVSDMLNKSRDDIAYNLIDIETDPGAELMAKIAAIESVINVRLVT